MKFSVRRLGKAALTLLAALPFANVVTPIRNRGKQIKRNADCPCGSGKKYKACCHPSRLP